MSLCFFFYYGSYCFVRCRFIHNLYFLEINILILKLFFYFIISCKNNSFIQNIRLLIMYLFHNAKTIHLRIVS